MKRVFLDTNIIVDFLTSRAPYCDEARTIMALGINKKIRLYAASMSFATVSYLIRKQYKAEEVKRVTGAFIRYCNVTVICVFPLDPIIQPRRIPSCNEQSRLVVTTQLGLVPKGL